MIVATHVSALLVACLSVAIAASSEPVRDIHLVQVPVTIGSQIHFYHLPWGTSRFVVRKIVQDDYGFLWFGSGDSLRRYDGHGFMRVPGADDPSPIGFVIAESLLKGRSGKLWFGVDDYVGGYDPATGKIRQYRAPAGDPCGPLRPVVHINQDREGALWLATEHGLRRLDPETSQLSCYQHDENDPASIASNRLTSTLETSDGRLWVASVGGLDVFDRRTGKVMGHVQLEAGGKRLGLAVFPSQLFQDHSGLLWAGLSSGGDLASIDPVSLKVTVYSFHRPGSNAAPCNVLSMVEDQEGALWLGTNVLGLIKLDRDRKQAVWYESNPDDPKSLGGDLVVSLFADREGSFWAVTKGGDVYRFDPHPPAFRSYRRQPGNPESLIDDSVLSAYEDSRGILWVGSERGLNRIDRKTEHVTRYESGLFNKGVRSIAEDDRGYLWFGTRGSGLVRFDPRTEGSRTYRNAASDPGSISADYVASLWVDRKGTLWAATEYGIDRYHPETNNFQHYRPPKNWPRYHHIAEQADGMLWLACTGDGLDRFNPQTGEFKMYRPKPDDARSLSHNRVYSVYVDRAGTVWVGTYAGLDRFNPTDESFTHYTQRDGLPAKSVLGILEDEKGYLWISTPDGLSRFDPRAGRATNYHSSDGLPADLFSITVTAFRSRRGEMFFGSYSGLVAFFPDQVVDHPSTPPVVLTDFRLFGDPVPIGKAPLEQRIWASRSLTLPQRSIFSFEFSALSYADPARTRYRYKLEGLDSKWNEADSTHRFATYTTLPPRNYTLRVEARTSRGEWSTNGVAMPVVILPPWYETWWFRCVLGLAILGLIRAFYQIRLRKVVQEYNIRLEARVDERTRIARELHDTLLQSFQGLMLRFQVGVNRLPTGKAKDALEKALDLGDQAILEGREAIQDLRVSAEETNDLARPMRALGDELGVDHLAAFRVTVEGPPRELHPILRDEIYRIAREAVRNAFHHAQAQHIEVEISYSEKLLVVRIRDDGRGIDSKVVEEGRTGHYGLPGMRERAARIGGELNVWTGEGAGTEIELSIPGSIAFGTAPGSRLRFWGTKAG